MKMEKLMCLYSVIFSPNKSLENRRENAGAFPASQLQRYVKIPTINSGIWGLLITWGGLGGGLVSHLD